MYRVLQVSVTLSGQVVTQLGQHPRRVFGQLREGMLVCRCGAAWARNCLQGESITALPKLGGLLLQPVMGRAVMHVTCWQPPCTHLLAVFAMKSLVELLCSE